MSIQEFSERFLTRLDKQYEQAANHLVNAAKLFDHNRCGYLAGYMEATHKATEELKEVRKLYLTESNGEQDDNDRTSPLY